MKKYNFLLMLSVFFGLFLLTSFEKDNSKNQDNRKCFELLTDIYSHRIVVIFSDDGTVSGTLDVHIDDKENGYENSSYSEFTGVLEGNEIKVDMEIDMEGEITTESEIWIYEDDYLIRNEMKYYEVGCD